jgi:hypothetical protein
LICWDLSIGMNSLKGRFLFGDYSLCAVFG